MRHSKQILLLSLLVLSLLSSAASRANAQESEPNDSCTSPQDLGAVTLPLSLMGDLGAPDVDFFRTLLSTSNASGTVVIDLEALEGMDTVLGVFGSDCTLLAVDDDSGAGFNSQIRINVPADGVLIIAATSYADFGFTGQGSYSGPYHLSIREEGRAVAVSGRIVDAGSGAPIPFADVFLYRCPSGSCSEFVGHLQTDTQGDFRFDGNFLFLLSGQYLISVSANNYQSTTDFFVLSAGVDLDLGDIALQRIPTASSIYGRVVDSLTGAPLSGSSIPFAWVELLFCDPSFFFCYTIRYAFPDSQGNYRFDGGPGQPLPPGTYRVRAYADQYLTGESESFTVGDGEDHDAGTLGLKSFPVRVDLFQSCGQIPSSGGNCQFSVRISNGMESRLGAEVWSLVEAFGIGSPVSHTSFQTGLPKTINLAPGESTTVSSSFFVPGEISDGAYICVSGFAARRPHSFNTLGQHHLFCLSKGGGFFSVVPESQKRDLVRKLKGQGPRK
ncbi:MAG TPA: carboxypeptidase-like regulatory domain-containing protein [Thermoanaerobaculia bacterium]|nr:carboxypeptidase-like regulatory domain-containing protein [Thermoanaerobaculia bacterium]